MAGTFDFLNTPEARALLGLSQGLLAAGGPSRTPVGFGQAMGQGVQGMVQGQDDYMDRVYKQQALQMQSARAQQGADLPAAIQIANEFAKARAAGDTRRMNDIALAAKSFDRGVMIDPSGGATTMPGYAPAVASIEGTKAGYKQQAQKDVDLAMNPRIAGGEANARLSQQLAFDPQIAAATKTAEQRAVADAADAQAIPIIEQIRAYNAGSFESPYSAAALPVTRALPGEDIQNKVTNTDLLLQARTDLAAPLAKQLGVNPTDRDFQATLDRIFNANASQASRDARINALEQRIRARQAARSPAKEVVLTNPNQQILDVFEPGSTPPPAAPAAVDYKSKYGLK